MLLDRPEGPADSRGFVHRRIIGGISGFLGGGPLGAVTGVISGGGSSPIPQGPTDFMPDPNARPCRGIGMRRDPRTGECKRFIGTESGPDRPAPKGRGLDRAGQGYAHHPHLPMEDAVTVRRCERGHVLSWEGLCVSKRDIRNSDRMYPKPPPPLGTRTQLKAVRVASAFGTKLKANKKRLRKLARNLESG